MRSAWPTRSSLKSTAPDPSAAPQAPSSRRCSAARAEAGSADAGPPPREFRRRASPAPSPRAGRSAPRPHLPPSATEQPTAAPGADAGPAARQPARRRFPQGRRRASDRDSASDAPPAADVRPRPSGLAAALRSGASSSRTGTRRPAPMPRSWSPCSASRSTRDGSLEPASTCFRPAGADREQPAAGAAPRGAGDPRGPARRAVRLARPNSTTHGSASARLGFDRRLVTMTLRIGSCLLRPCGAQALGSRSRQSGARGRRPQRSTSPTKAPGRTRHRHSRLRHQRRPADAGQRAGHRRARARSWREVVVERSAQQRPVPPGRPRRAAAPRLCPGHRARISLPGRAAARDAGPGLCPRQCRRQR